MAASVFLLRRRLRVALRLNVPLTLLVTRTELLIEPPLGLFDGEVAYFSRVSETVPALISGVGLSFESRGEYESRGSGTAHFSQFRPEPHAELGNVRAADEVP